MYTLQAQPKLSILQQEFFILSKNDKKVNYIEKICENNLEVAKICLGYKKLSIFNEVFHEKKIKRFA